MDFTILNWNIGGAKYLEETEDKREKTRDLLNDQLKRLIEHNNHPHVVTLQEIVRYGETKEKAIDIIDPIKGYSYYPFTLIDTESLSSKDKWNKVKRNGDWPLDYYFAQGNAMLFRDDMPHFHVWDLLCSSSFNWDDVSQDNNDVNDVLLKLLKNAFGNDLMNNVYLFNWDKIPENPDEKQRLMEFLVQNCNMNWVKEGIILIKKSDNGKNINISNEKDLFNWNEIPENPDENQRLIDFLKKNCNVNWVKQEKIKKINDNVIVMSVDGKLMDEDGNIFSSNKKQTIEIRLDEKKEKAILKISDDRTYNLKVRNENGKLNIYPEGTKFTSLEINNEADELTVKRENGRENKYEWLKICNDGKTITISTKKKWVFKISLDEKKEKATLEINDGKSYLFSWDKIPGNDSGRLIEFLTQKFGIDWVKTAKIEKIDDGRTIKVSIEKNYLSLTLNDKKTNVNIEIDDGKTDEFIVENGELNIYKPYNLKVKKENGKLNIYIPVAVGCHLEQVHLRPGLYFGNRDTEPRCALVSHFIINPDGEKKKPLDIFVVNVHLTTSTREREGIPRIDHEASIIRQSQLEVIFYDIVSQYNSWRAKKFPEREEKRILASGETIERQEPVWVIAGDFNFTPESDEYKSIMSMNFMDTVPVPMKGSGTKSKGVGHPPTLTVDYIFAGPKFISLDLRITEEGIKDNRVDTHAKGSDHFPIYAKIPLALPEKK